MPDAQSIETSAYAACRRLAAAHYENFPVASWLLPAGLRDPIAAVYAFARHADDFADEGDRSDAERLQLLQQWREWLYRAEASTGPKPEDDCGWVFAALSHTIRTHQLPVGLFDDLISAFEQDVTVRRYAHWTELFDYCRRSANPVGRLVLRIAGYRDGALDRASDCVCTALQLTNFLQDFDRDWRHGRLYVPAEVYTAAGADPADLDQARLTDPWRDALQAVAARTRQLFDKGRAVCEGVTGRLGLELRLTWLGGCHILDRLGWSGYDPRRERPTLGVRDVPVLLWHALRWSSAGAGARS